MADLSKRKYLRYDAPGVTDIPATETEDIKSVIKMFDMLMGGDFDKHGHAYPVTHARTLGIVKGKLVVPNNLPAHLKQGFFAKAQEYPVVMRYSSQSHDVGADDRVTSFRAASIKIFNVHGERLPEGAGMHTQDFAFNSSSSEQDLSDAKTAREVIGLRMRGIADPKGMVEALMARPDAELQLRQRTAPMAPVETLSYYSQVPYRFGNYVGKHGIFPASEELKKLTEKRIDAKADSSHVLSEWLEKFYSENEAVYEWRWQLCENLSEQSVEFAGSKWDPEKYPYQTVARLVFPKQDPRNFELKSFWEDHMRIAPWRGLKSFEPLGGTNRVRKAIYPHARQMREKVNGRKAYEVRKMEDLPGPIPPGIPKEGMLQHFFS